MPEVPRDVQNDIDSQVGREIGGELEKRAQAEFAIIKKQLMDEFEGHSITKEIDAGPNASNSSGLLGGYGNLFSFLGFKRDSDPMSIVRSELDRTKIKKILIKKGDLILMTTEPTREQLFAATPLSWAPGRSWLQGLEGGVSGLGFYLFQLEGFKSGSESGTGLQLKGRKKAKKAFGGFGSSGGLGMEQRTRYKNVPYVSRMLNNFKKEVNKLNRRLLK